MDPYSNDPNMNMTPVKRTQPSSNAAVPMGNSLANNANVWDFGGGGSEGQKTTVGASDNWSRTPGYGQDKIYQKNDGQWAGSGSDEVNEAVDYDWNSLISTYEGMGQGGDERVGPGQATIGAPPPQTFNQGDSAFKNVGGGGGGGGYGGSVYQGPVFDYPELNLPEPFEYGASLDLPDYTPPEYDEGHERAIREEFIQTNKGAMSKSTQQAILGSSNVNNPQARGQIIKAALEGFGEALGQTTLKGSQEGRRSAEKKHGRDTGVYNTQFDIQSKEVLAEYDQSMKEDLMAWELELGTAQADYQNQLNQWNKMPGDVQAQNMSGGNKGVSQNQTPFMGYM